MDMTKNNKLCKVVKYAIEKNYDIKDFEIGYYGLSCPNSVYLEFVNKDLNIEVVVEYFDNGKYLLRIYGENVPNKFAVKIHTKTQIEIIRNLDECFNSIVPCGTIEDENMIFEAQKINVLEFLPNILKTINGKENICDVVDSAKNELYEIFNCDYNAFNNDNMLKNEYQELLKIYDEKNAQLSKIHTMLTTMKRNKKNGLVVNFNNELYQYGDNLRGKKQWFLICHNYMKALSIRPNAFNDIENIIDFYID